VDDDALRELVRRALAEDRADDDVTTRATVPADAAGVARLITRSACVLAGGDAFALTFQEIGAVDVALEPDGTWLEPGSTAATVTGPLRAILAAERTALNFAQRLSGIATLTRAFVDRAGGVPILDTRKTTPGLRALEKAAVVAGGGRNHRSDLAEAILIKDNHIVAAGGIEAAIAGARATGMAVEVECDTLDQVTAAVSAGVEAILLDNMDLPTLREAVRIAGGRARIEASGGVTLETVGDIAKTGVDVISVGALTHSAPAADLSLEITDAARG
jgi:nicotinate-nucleotide pyrophosphorylase (carboxylating)